MTFRPLNADQAAEAVQALEAHDGNKSAAARSLNLDRGTFKHRLAAAERLGVTGRTSPAPDGFEVKELTEIRDKDGALKSQSTKYRTEGGDYQIPTGMALKGVSLLSEVEADGTKTPRLIWEKAREGEPDPEHIAKTIRQAFEGFTPKAP